MILHPGILALLLGSGLSLLLLGRAVLLAWRLQRQWDAASSSARQLQLERESDLVATLVRCALGFECAALVLFLYTVDDLHPLFVGAMCATGTLNLHPAGWYALLVRIVLCLGAACWLTLDHLDRSVAEAPLVVGKYRLLLVLAPLAASAAILQLRYFLALHPEVITSCCGALFDSGRGVAAELAGLAPLPTMAASGSLLLLTLLLLGLCLRVAAAWPRYLLAACALLLLPVSLAAVISFLSLYIYALPTHHCPFDMLQRPYYFIGYPLYLSLFFGAQQALLPGLCRPLRRHACLHNTLERLEQRWLWRALAALTVFTLLTLGSIVFSPFSLLAST